jgi:hypothetical protein
LIIRFLQPRVQRFCFLQCSESAMTPNQSMKPTAQCEAT